MAAQNAGNLPAKASTSGISKRKKSVMTFERKVELIKTVESGVPRSVVCAEYKVSKSTLSDILKAKETIFDYFSRSESDKLIRNRKVTSKAKVQDVDNAVWQWYKQTRDETKKAVPGWLIIEKAQAFHQAMKIQAKCMYSSGWLRSFKRRHGLKYLKIQGEKESADNEGAEEYVKKFAEMVAGEDLSPEQIYNADETGLCWRKLPTRTMTYGDDSASGFKDNKQRVTVLCCANAAGTHKCKLLVIGISKNPRCFTKNMLLPVIYKNQPNSWMSREIFADWFNKNFVPEVKRHLKSVGLAENSKVVLLLDNSATHPHKDELVNGNITASFLPPNTTSLIQPMDQGVIKNLKEHYKRHFTRRLHAVKGTVKEFYKVFTVKSAIYAIASSWDDVKLKTLRNGWGKLWPEASLFPEEDTNEADFEGFKEKKISERKKLREELLAYVRGIQSPELRAELVTETLEEDIDRWIDYDEDAPTSSNMTEDEIIDLVQEKQPEDSDDDEEEEEEEDEEKEKGYMETAQTYFEWLLKFFESSKSEFGPQDYMSLYSMYMRLLQKRAQGKKQLSIKDCFARVAKKPRIEPPGPSSPENVPSTLTSEGATCTTTSSPSIITSVDPTPSTSTCTI